MGPLRIPSEAEIRAAYREGEDAVVKLFYDTLGKLAERIQRLEDQLAKNSGAGVDVAAGMSVGVVISGGVGVG